jgi:hypothetical protein
MSDLTVWSVLWGDKYDKAYVYALKEMVEKNLSVPHQFRCITTQSLPGIVTVKPFVPYSGWWQKIGLFAPTIATGPSLYFDLDVVITGNIDYLADFTKHQFAAPANWAQSGHGGIQSSVMAWAGNWFDPFKAFNYQEHSKRLWGDQEFLWEFLGDKWERIPGIGSYKYHVRGSGKIPDWMNVCVFHGKPDPHEVKDKCLLPYTSTLNSLINKSMDNGSLKASSG